MAHVLLALARELSGYWLLDTKLCSLSRHISVFRSIASDLNCAFIRAVTGERVDVILLNRKWIRLAHSLECP